MDLNSINFWETLKKKVDEAVTIKKRGYDQILGDLKKTLRSNFPDTPIYAFGSRIMGIADADSDLDIYVHLDGNETYTENPTSKVSQNQVKIINSIKMDSGNWKFLDSHGGVCPIVIVRHIDSDIQCDISFSKKITVDQNNLINYIVDLQPIARYMVIYLRGWAQINGLTKFRGYIFNLMVIFFLQIRGKLPSIKDLQADLSPNFGQLGKPNL
ncbi:terminal uridylyltransferase Tailor-like isoform X2 [Drosophila kikkawai]|uniref:Terminal uridylyltransferase Tailor-like isoform X2 n=1 Tax=Drosophila kikkawai TaxID=30033 RepID=A0ABM4GJY1_DROKI